MADEMELLRERLDQGFEDIHRRMDDQRDLNTERHNTNLAKLTVIDLDMKLLTRTVNEVNGTVVGHTSDLKTIFSRGIPITLPNLRLYVAIGAGAVVAFVWLLHTLGLLK